MTRNYSQGFTFVELLVVIAIASIATVGGVAGYIKFNNRQIVGTAGKELLVALRQAQTKAFSSVKTTAGCDTTQLRGYRFLSIKQTSPTDYDAYTVSEKYETNCQAPNAGASEFVIKTVKLPSGMKFQGLTDLTFTGLSGGVILTTAQPITLCNTGCTLKYVISVTKDGLVQDSGLQ